MIDQVTFESLGKIFLYSCQQCHVTQLIFQSDCYRGNKVTRKKLIN